MGSKRRHAHACADATARLNGHADSHRTVDANRPAVYSHCHSKRHIHTAFANRDSHIHTGTDGHPKSDGISLISNANICPLHADRLSCDSYLRLQCNSRPRTGGFAVRAHYIRARFNPHTNAFSTIPIYADPAASIRF